jgi:hypothetical protein
VAHAVEPRDVKHPKWFYPARELTRRDRQGVITHQGLTEIFEFRHHGGGNLNGRWKGNFHNRFYTTKALGNSIQADSSSGTTTLVECLSNKLEAVIEADVTLRRCSCSAA